MVRIYKYWTKEEEKFLEENYLTMGNVELGEKLNRSKRGIKLKLFKLNLKRPNKIKYQLSGMNVWVKKDMEFLKNNYLTMSNVELGKELDRTQYGVKRMLSKLGLKRPKEIIYKMKYPNLWTIKEKKFLKDNYLVMGNVDLGRKLNRSKYSVQSKLMKLKLKRPEELVKQIMYLTKKGIHQSKETKKKIGQANKGNKRPDLGKFNTITKKGKTWEESYGINKSKELRAKMCIARSKRILPMKDTKIEVKLQDFLKQLDIKFVTHKYMKEIKNAYQCDIFIPSMNLVIEADGNYIHCNPSKYSKEFVRFPSGKNIMTAEDVWKRDRIRTSELKANGFRVLRLWEHEIKSMTLKDFKNHIHNKLKGGKL